jgi:xanthine dehydrogenase accessory factor
MTREIGDILREFERRCGEPLALATLVRTEGSSYRQPGARMLIARDGTTVGSLSGGCLENEIAIRGRSVIRHGQPVLLSFDTRAKFGCHGSISVLVERMAETSFLAGLANAQRARRSCVVATNTHRGSYLTIRNCLLSPEDFVQQIDPPIRLLIVGEGPDTGPLRSLAAILGWECLCAQRAADLAATPDRWTAAVIGTHNYGRDFAALRALLQQELPYIGLLGSRRRREQLLADVLDTGVSPRRNLYSPVGLDLGGDAPEEIALAVIAEIQAAFAGGSAQPLRHARRPIHQSSAAERRGEPIAAAV